MCFGCRVMDVLGGRARVLGGRDGVVLGIMETW